MARVPETPIAFVKGESTRYRSSLRRRDGVVVELDGGGYNRVGGPAGRVPHDLAHFVVEDALGLVLGLWGVLAAGGMFDHATVVDGRRPPHAARRAQAVVDRAGGRLAQAELLVRGVADVALAGRDDDVDLLRRTVGDRGDPGPVAPGRLQTACSGLREAAVRWADLRPGDHLDVVWRLRDPGR